MNEETIEEMLDSSFDFDFSSDDSDNDPNWDAKNAEIMSTSSTSSKQYINNVRHVNVVSIDGELSGVDEIVHSDENDDPNFDMVSHVSASSDGDSTTINRGPGRPRIRPNINIDDRQWREDDNIIDDFVFNPHDTNLNS